MALGIIECPKHGRQFGPHCCDHLCKAVYDFAVLNKSRVNIGTTSFYDDYLGDGTMLLDFMVCSDCATLCAVSESKTIRLELLGEDHVSATWPPVCEKCVNEWNSGSES